MLLSTGFLTIKDTITALGAPGSGCPVFKLEIIKTRLMQEEKWREICHNNDQTKAALFNSSPQLSHGPGGCRSCERRGDTQKGYWDKFPSFRATHFSWTSNDNKKRVLVAVTKSKANIRHDDRIFLLVWCCSLSGRCFNKSNTSIVNDSSLVWFIYSGVSFHMTPELSSFSKFEYAELLSVEMGEISAVDDKGHVDVERSITGSTTK